jgi:hypothetical protein
LATIVTIAPPADEAAVGLIDSIAYTFLLTIVMLDGEKSMPLLLIDREKLPVLCSDA